MKEKHVGMGVFSFITLIIGLLSIGFYMTGDRFMDDTITMAAGFSLIFCSFILSLFSKKSKLGKISLYTTGLLLILGGIFFGIMSLIWAQA